MIIKCFADVERQMKLKDDQSIKKNSSQSIEQLMFFASFTQFAATWEIQVKKTSKLFTYFTILVVANHLLSNASVSIHLYRISFL